MGVGDEEVGTGRLALLPGQRLLPAGLSKCLHRGLVAGGGQTVPDLPAAKSVLEGRPRGPDPHFDHGTTQLRVVDGPLPRHVDGDDSTTGDPPAHILDRNHGHPVYAGIEVASIFGVEVL